jgi:hypothetical protein
MAKEVRLSSSAQKYIEELIFKLIDKGYFSSIEKAIAYADKLVDLACQTILLPGGKHLDKENTFYVSVRMNKRTTWYVYYLQKVEKYLIVCFANNHVCKSAKAGYYVNLR